MRKFYVVVIAFCLAVPMKAQRWSIPETEINVVKKGGELLLIFGASDTLSFEADTAYREGESGVLLVEGGGLMAVVDPWDFYVIHGMDIKSIKRMYGYVLIGDNSGFYFVEGLTFMDKVSEVYDELNLLAEKVDIYEGRIPCVVKKGGKYGLMDLTNSPDMYIVKLDYDEIVFDFTNDEAYGYRVRKGNKWGVGGCEGVELEPKFDRVEFVTGECSYALYKVWKKGLCGVQQSYAKKPVIDLKYSRIEILRRYEHDYMFLFEGDELSCFYTFDGYEIDEKRIPVVLIESVSTKKNYLVFETPQGLDRLELSEQEALDLDLVIDKIYL